MESKLLKKKIANSALKAVKGSLVNLPFNRSSSFIMVHLRNAKCDLYIPVIPRENRDMEIVRDAWQNLIDAAEL